MLDAGEDPSGGGAVITAGVADGGGGESVSDPGTGVGRAVGAACGLETGTETGLLTGTALWRRTAHSAQR